MNEFSGRLKVIDGDQAVTKAAEYARLLQEGENYERKILGVKWTDRVPENARPYGDGMDMIVGENRAYSSRPTMRRVNQQIPHIFEHRKYMIMGQLEQIEDPDVIMIITDPQRVMRLCKAYTWKTGEVVHALGGTCWCGMSFPQVLRDKTMTFNFGDPPARAIEGYGQGQTTIKRLQPVNMGL